MLKKFWHWLTVKKIYIYEPPAEILELERLKQRDRFAMAALPAVVAAVCEGHISPRPNVAQTEIIAEQAYKVADAMLAARGDQ